MPPSPKKKKKVRPKRRTQRVRKTKEKTEEALNSKSKKKARRRRSAKPVISQALLEAYAHMVSVLEQTENAVARIERLIADMIEQRTPIEPGTLTLRVQDAEPRPIDPEDVFECFGPTALAELQRYLRGAEPVKEIHVFKRLPKLEAKRFSREHDAGGDEPS